MPKNLSIGRIECDHITDGSPVNSSFPAVFKIPDNDPPSPGNVWLQRILPVLSSIALNADSDHKPLSRPP